MQEAGKIRVIVEILHDNPLISSESLLPSAALEWLEVDSSYQPVLISATPAIEGQGSSSTYALFGFMQPEQIPELKMLPRIVDAYPDEKLDLLDEPELPCNCEPSQPTAKIDEIIDFLNLRRLWALGIDGAGVVVGVVDSGITATGKPLNTLVPKTVDNVIGGWPADWGTLSNQGRHGNQTAGSIISIAKKASLLDIRLSSDLSVSSAVHAYRWAIDNFRSYGAPHILNNSWGIYKKSQAPVYSTNPNHVLNKLVMQAVEAGIVVLFGAGNCGPKCPGAFPECEFDSSFAGQIWGANGLQTVMTIAGVDNQSRYLGFCSRGPAALSNWKPDFCSVSQFENDYSSCNGGTSAACASATGVVALLKQAFPSATPDSIKKALMRTARDPWQKRWTYETGAGILDPAKAYDFLEKNCSRTMTAMV